MLQYLTLYINNFLRIIILFVFCQTIANTSDKKHKLQLNLPQLMQDTAMNMQITLRRSSQKYKQTKKIFDQDFKVQQMYDPKKYLVQYQQNQVYNTSCFEDCQVGIGNICMYFAIPFACFGCTNCCCCFTLGTAQVGLVESFGRFSRLLKPGMNLINPCSEQVRQVNMRINILRVGRNLTMTKDNVKITIDSNIAYRVTNPILAFYVLGSNQNRALVEATTAALRDIVGNYTLDKVLQSRSQIGQQARKLVINRVPQGIHVQNVFIEQIIVPPEIQKDLTSAARQKRLGQASIINSKADVEAASLMKQSAQLLDTKAAMQIRYLQMVEELGKRGVTLMMGIGVNKKGF